MLILTRKLNEEIKIGPDITVRILASSEGQVKIGIDAPSSVQILRGEIFSKIVESTVDASEQSKLKVEGITSLKLNKLKRGKDAEQ